MLYNRLFIFSLILIVMFAIGWVFTPKPVYYYNAYAPGYDEYFILKSYQILPLDTITHFDDQAVSTTEKTGYTARVLSPYIK